MNNGGLLPYIPEYITVHLGPASSDAPNVTVSFADYIKNVASSEIYPTWPESAIRANILAQISFALNRIYTEYYRSRGYDFDITNSTANDQSFVNGREIFENISQTVDDIFNEYISRQGAVEPLFATYCDGVRVQCEGLSQWGSVALANQGRTPYEILTNYYGNDIDIVTGAPIEGQSESYPGTPVRFGSTGNEVAIIQRRLNRISRNYPAIPKILRTDGVFDSNTEQAIREFQRIFSLEDDGIVGRGTWYRIEAIYNAVKRVSELNSEGIPTEDIQYVSESELKPGDTGGGVRELQYYLNYVSAFNEAIPSVIVDGIFGPATQSAVESFQREYGLTPTGTVTLPMWERLYSAYRGILETLPSGLLPSGLLPYPGYPLRYGFSGDDVAFIQELLNYISNTYTEIPKLTVDGVFGTATENAVKTYQRLFGLPTVNGRVGAVTWNSVVERYLELKQSREGREGQFSGELSRGEEDV